MSNRTVSTTAALYALAIVFGAPREARSQSIADLAWAWTSAEASDPGDGFVTGEIGPGEDGWYSFTAFAGVTYVIETALGSLPDTTLTLCHIDGTPIAFDDDGGGGLASRIVWMAQVDDEYLVRVAAYGSYQSGTYYVRHIEHRPHDGEIEVSGEVDAYSFTAFAGVTYVIETTLGGLPDTTLTLYGTDGDTLIAFDDDGGNGLASRIVWTPSADGVYFLEVAAYAGYQSGAYQVMAMPIPIPSPASLPLPPPSPATTPIPLPSPATNPMPLPSPAVLPLPVP